MIRIRAGEVIGLAGLMTERGRRVLLVTSEPPERLGLSDRVMVLREGRIAAEFRREPFDPERVLAAAPGHAL